MITLLFKNFSYADENKVDSKKITRTVAYTLPVYHLNRLPLNEFISTKKQYTILDFKENNGPAFSKWKFIEYIQNNLDKYSVNDICIIVDGDDYLLENALNIINNTYINNKCWCTFGERSVSVTISSISVILLVLV